MHLHPVATALAPHRYRQMELRDAAVAQVAAPARRAEAAMFDRSRIESRAFAVPVEWLLQPHGFRDRMAAYVETGLPMAEEAARSALTNARMDASDLGGIVFVSTTGLAAPSLDVRLANRLGFSPGIARVPVWGLGCAGGVAGLARSSDLAAARQQPVLLVALELCSLSFDVAKALRGDKKALVAASLFADGCAAVIVDPHPTGLRLTASASHLFPDSERVMGWDVEDHNLDVVLSPDLPQLVADRLGAVVRNFTDAPDHWILHPGGAKVLDAMGSSLHLASRDLEATAAVLRDHGNMSSPTVLHVLAEARRNGAKGRMLMAALGPGFAAELALLEA